MKLPPQNIEAEESLLCSCLLNDPAEILDILVPEDFYKPAHQKIFRAISSLKKAQQPIDLTSTTTELRLMDCLPECGGATYLSKLLDEIPQAVNPPYYAKLIKSASVGRRIISKANDIANSIYKTTITNGNIVELLDKAQADILDINFDLGHETFTTFPNLCMSRIDQYEELSKGKVLGLKTGFPSLDYLTGGFWGSKLIVIAARPRIGKTAIMLNMAKNMAQRGHNIGIFSIEMDKEELMDRQIAGESGINSIRLATGYNITAEEWRKIHEAAGKIYNYSIIIDDTGGITIQEIKRRSRKMVKQGVEMIFIDQLSKIRGGAGKSEYEQRSFIVNELATLKKELRIPICLLCQINRNADNRPNNKPTLSDIKSTGSVEEDADILLIGHRPFLYTKDPKDEGLATWELAKHRQGPTRNIEMRFDEKTTTFYEIAKEGHY